MKEKIKEVAAKLIAENGYAATSMREIAEALNVTKAALYHHYISKEAILEYIVIESMTRMNDLHTEIAISQVSVWEKLRIWSDAAIQQANNYPNTRTIIFYIMTGRFQNQIHIDLKPYMEKSMLAMRQVLLDGVEAGEIRIDIPIELMIAHFFSTVNGIMMSPVLKYPGITTQIVLDSIMKFFEGGYRVK